MNNKHKSDRRTSRIVIRVTKKAHSEIARRATSSHQSISDYCLNAINQRHGDTKVIRLSKAERIRVLKGISIMETELQEYHSDYARYLANLNHAMKLYNSHQTPYVNEKSLREAESVAKSSELQLAMLKQNLHQLEAIIWR